MVRGISKRFSQRVLECLAVCFVGVLLVAGVASCGGNESSSQNYALSHITYSYFSASSISDTPGSLADFAGRPLVVNFWASWCPPCVREMPEIEAVYQLLQSQVAFLGINVTDEREDALELMGQTGVSYLQATDPDGAIQLRLGAVIMPTTLFVSPKGEVLDRWSGILDESSLHSKIEENFGIS